LIFGIEEYEYKEKEVTVTGVRRALSTSHFWMSKIIMDISMLTETQAYAWRHIVS